MKILVLSCSLNPESRSRVLARAALDALGEMGIEAAYIDLRDVELPPCDGAEAYSAPALGPLAAGIGEAAAILVAAPIYNFDLNSAAKNVVELTGRAWTGKIVGFLCAAGGPESYMAPMGLANSLMLDFRCLVVPRFVYATGDAFDGDGIADEKVAERVVGLCAETVRIAGALLSN